MKQLLERAGVFYRTLRDCVSSAWREVDTHYYLPRTRFRGSFKESARDLPQPEAAAGKRLRVFYGSLTHCLSTAWSEARRHDHLPRRQFRKAFLERQMLRPVQGIGNALTDQASFTRLRVQGTGFYESIEESGPVDRGAQAEREILPEPGVPHSRSPTVTRD